jgi:alpha-1,6-mannosyltransferase
MGVDVAFAQWFAVLNPMLVISYIGGAHNDSLMMGLMVLGVWLAFWGVERGRWWGWLAGAVVVGVAAAVKQPAIMAASALPLVVRGWEGWRPREVAVVAGRAIAALAVSAGTFCLVTLASGLGFGWIHAIDVPGRNITAAPFSLAGAGLRRLLNWLYPAVDHDWVVDWAHRVGLGVGFAIIAVLALTIARRKPLAFLSYGYLAFALTAPSLRTWDVQWCVVLLPLAHIGPRMIRTSVWGTLTMLGFDAVQMAWRNSVIASGVVMAWVSSAIAIGVAGVLALAWLMLGHDLAHRG